MNVNTNYDIQVSRWGKEAHEKFEELTSQTVLLEADLIIKERHKQLGLTSLFHRILRDISEQRSYIAKTNDDPNYMDFKKRYDGLEFVVREHYTPLNNKPYYELHARKICKLLAKQILAKRILVNPLFNNENIISQFLDIPDLNRKFRNNPFLDKPNLIAEFLVKQFLSQKLMELISSKQIPITLETFKSILDPRLNNPKVPLLNPIREDEYKGLKSTFKIDILSQEDANRNYDELMNAVDRPRLSDLLDKNNRSAKENEELQQELINLEQKEPTLYEAIRKTIILTESCSLAKVSEKAKQIIGTLTLKIGNRSFAATRYVFYGGRHDIQSLWNKETNVLIFHPSQDQVSQMLDEIANYFAHIVCTKPNKFRNKLPELATLVYYFCHCQPYLRGNAAMIEMLVASICLACGYNVEFKKKLDLEALATLKLSEFVERFPRMIILTPVIPSDLNKIDELYKELKQRFPNKSIKAIQDLSIPLGDIGKQLLLT